MQRESNRQRRRALAMAAAILAVACCSCRSAPTHKMPERPGLPRAAAAPAEAASAPATLARAEAWPFAVPTREALHGLGIFHPGVQWREFQHNGMELAVAIEEMPTDGESYIDVYAYVFNRHFKEWRRFIAVQVRGAGKLELRLDTTTGTLIASGGANNDLRGKPLMAFDLRAVYDDR